MATTLYIKATDGTDFHRQVSIFAYSEYVRHQRGVVLIAEGGFCKHPDGSVEATLTYVAHQEEPELLPPEAIQMVQDYDPERESVLAMMETTGKATCITLTAQDTGTTPKRLFEEAIKQSQHVPIMPGTVVRLHHAISGIEPGWFVFLGEDKAELALARAGEDDDGEIVPTDEVHRVHVDFRDSLEVAGIKVDLNG